MEGGGPSHLDEEVVSQNVVQVWSVLRGLGQQTGDELLGRGGQGGGQGVASLSYAPVCLLQVGGLKGRSAKQHGVPGWGVGEGRGAMYG